MARTSRYSIVSPLRPLPSSHKKPHPKGENTIKETKGTLFSSASSFSLSSSSRPRVVEIPPPSLSAKERRMLKKLGLKTPKGIKINDAMVCTIPASSLTNLEILNILKKLGKLRTLMIYFSDRDLIEKLHLNALPQSPGLHLKLGGVCATNLDLHVSYLTSVSQANHLYAYGKPKIHYYDENGTYLRSETARGIFYKTNLVIKNYNGVHTFEGGDIYSCRHIAMDDLLFLENHVKKRIDGGFKEYINHAAFRNNILGKDGEKISTRPRQLEDQYKTLLAFGKDNHIVSNAYWNVFCQNQWKYMQEELSASKGRRVTRKFIVLSSNHAMALRLVVKNKKNKLSYAISFFDPNQTTTDTRVVFDYRKDVDTCGSLFNNFLDDDARRAYFGINALQACALFIRVPEQHARKTPPPKRQVQYYGKFPLSTPFLYYAMRANLLHLDTCQTYIKGSMVFLKGTPDLLFKFFSAKGLDGLSGLYIALEKGHTKAVEAYMRELTKFAKAKRLTGDPLYTLLLAEGGDGMTGFHMTCLKGHLETAKIYIKALIQLTHVWKPRDAHIETLLLARDFQGGPVLYMGLQEGRVELINLYAEALLKFAQAEQLTSPQIEKFLLAKNAHKIPGFHTALWAGDTTIVTAYINAIVTFARENLLTNKQIETILISRDDQGNPGLHVALWKGHTTTAIAYMKAIREFAEMGKLTDPQLEKLLLAQDKQGISGPRAALHNGKTATFMEYLIEMARCYHMRNIQLFRSKDFFLSIQDEDLYSNPSKIETYIETLQQLGKEKRITDRMLKEILVLPSLREKTY